MHKVRLIIAREFLSRVRKKSFIIMTLLGPILFGAIMFLPVWLATREGDAKRIRIVDRSGYFEEAFVGEQDEQFTYSTDKSLDEAKAEVAAGEYDGLLFIPELQIDNPQGIVYYAPNNPSISLIHSLSWKLETQLESEKLRRSGISREVLEGLKADVSIGTINLSGEEETKGSSVGASVIGYAAGFLIYIFIFVYGAMCMRGVIEEKSSRIIEVIISSVKPFQLMMGKVIGIASVGLTQFVLWIVLTIGITTAVGGLIATTAPDQQVHQVGAFQPEQTGEVPPDIFGDVSSAIGSVNIPMVMVAFLFFFVAGYLLYGALFAAVGSAVDSDADAQQFMFPVTMPLILSIISLTAVLNDPNGSLAFWLSMVPLTSPVVMMMRVPFGVPVWELVLSMLLMVGGFMFTTWVAGRIYRVGILMHGTRVNYKVLAKWFMTNV